VLLLDGGRVVTDCRAVYNMWNRIRRNPACVQPGVSARCWVALKEALAEHPTVCCGWMRSHLTLEQAVAAGFPARWQLGNSMADEAAKRQSAAVNPPRELLHQHRQHEEQARKVIEVAAAIQLQRLQSRARTADGAALKVRVRHPPGLPRRLRQAGLKRKVSSPPVAAVDVALPSCGDILQAKVQEMPAPCQARLAVESSPQPAEGIHDLRPKVWPAAGSGVVKNGRMAGAWECTRCARKAADTSRAVQLARTRCGEHDWEATFVPHHLVGDARGWSCSRCRLTVRPQHAAQASTQRCPVPSLNRGGTAWPDGESSLREVLGRVKAFRHYCTPREAEVPAEATPADGGAAPAEPAAQRRRMGAQCWVPGSRLPMLRVGPSECDPMEFVFDAGGAADAGSAAGGVGGLAAGSVVGAVAASGPGVPDAGPGEDAEPGELDAVPGVSEVAVSSAPLLPGVHFSCLGGASPQHPQVVPCSLPLQAYKGHAVAFVGRNLWCLDCFQAPGKAHRSWRHGRCEGIRPLAALPAALRHAIARQAGATPELPSRTRDRWTELAGALGGQ